MRSEDGSYIIESGVLPPRPMLPIGRFVLPDTTVTLFAPSFETKTSPVVGTIAIELAWAWFNPIVLRGWSANGLMMAIEAFGYPKVATYKYPLNGLYAMGPGYGSTGIVLRTALVVSEMTLTEAPPMFVTTTQLAF